MTKELLDKMDKIIIRSDLNAKEMVEVYDQLALSVPMYIKEEHYIYTKCPKCKNIYQYITEMDIIHARSTSSALNVDKYLIGQVNRD